VFLFCFYSNSMIPGLAIAKFLFLGINAVVYYTSIVGLTTRLLGLQWEMNADFGLQTILEMGQLMIIS